MTEADKHTGIEVPFERLSPEAFRGLVEQFVLREGTDYGNHEFSLSEKVSHVVRQIEIGKAMILFDPDSGSCNISLR